MRRVVITGAGTINPLGCDVAATWDAMRAGRCAIGKLAFRDVERLSIQIGAQVQEYAAEDHFSRSQIALMDRFTQFAMIAAQQAVIQSAVALDHGRAGVILGTSGGGLETQNDSFRTVFQDGKNRVHPFTVPRLMANAAASHISMTYGATGPCYTVSTACASSNHAMGQAFELIAGGGADVILTGGSEAMLNFGGLKAWEGLRVMSPTGCRPFCATRDGMVQGEGAAVFVFEDREAALARGADILAEVAGFAMTSDAGDIVAPLQAGASGAMRAALLRAQMAPSDIGYVNAHGTGTTLNDKIEAAALNEVFEAGSPPISSTKSMHGHLIGGTGAVELLALILALREGVIAPTVGHAQIDPTCDLDVVVNTARTMQVTAALSNAFAFGGLNAVLALRQG
jgi:nodulation protein E